METYYFEGHRILNPVSFYSNKVVIQNETLSLDVNRMVLPAQRWELSFKLVTSGNEADIFHKLTVDRYSVGSMIMPQMPDAWERTTFLGSASVQANAAAGQGTVYVVPLSSGLLPKGSFIQFGTQKKVYMTTADVNFSYQQTVNVPIFPKLVEAVDSTTSVNFEDDVTFHYLIDDTAVSGMTFNQGTFSDIGVIRLLEVRK